MGHNLDRCQKSGICEECDSVLYRIEENENAVVLFKPGRICAMRRKCDLAVVPRGFMFYNVLTVCIFNAILTDLLGFANGFQQKCMRFFLLNSL